MVDWAAYVRGRLKLTGLDPAREAEVVEDVAQQLDDAYREAVAAGLSEADARLRAETHIADWDALAGELSASPRLRQPAVDRWSARLDDRAIARGRFTLWSRLGADVRYGIRLMLKTPGFSALAIVMLALGTGANAAVFSVVDAVILRSPFERPEEIAQVTVTGADGRRTGAVPRDVFERLAGMSHLVTSAAIRTISSPVVTNVEVPRRTQVECVSAAMIGVLGSRPFMGRWFSPDEDTPSGPPVGVVSFKFWQGTLNADPDVLGRRIMLDGSPLTVVGVMRPGFDGALSLIDRDIHAPIGQSTAARQAFGCPAPGETVSAFVRVRSGLSLADAGAAATAAIGGPLRIDLLSIAEETVGDLKGMFAALTGTVLAILLIACANVANLGLARLVGRRREIAVRLALGATRGRILRQTVTEQLVVGTIGAAAGVLVAVLTFEAVLALLPRGLPHAAAVELNARVLAASIGVTLAAALAVGLIPALQASAIGLRAGLSQDDRAQTPGSRRSRWTLVVSELALGTMLLVGALLMIRTFLTLRPSEPGFDPANKVAALVRVEGLPVAESRAFRNEVVKQLLESPGIGTVAMASHLPLVRTVALWKMTLDGASAEVITRFISPNYQDVMRMPVARGRALAHADGPAAPPVLLVNEAFVRRWMPDREPLGAVVTLGSPRSKTPVVRRIVGIVGDTRYAGSDTRPRPEVFVPIEQETFDASYFIIGGTPAALAAVPATLRRITTGLRPGQLVDRIERLEAILADAVSYPRLGAWLLGLFGGLAVLLSAIGLGGTLAWSVAERRREIGVRMALGASPGAIRTLVIRHAMRLTSLAIAIGLTGAWFASRLIEGWIYGVTRTDAVTYAACGAAMLVVSLVAAYLPTRRATRVDPLTSLRAE
jgi:putative ABC transport system permease protein